MAKSARSRTTRPAAWRATNACVMNSAPVRGSARAKASSSSGGGVGKVEVDARARSPSPPDVSGPPSLLSVADGEEGPGGSSWGRQFKASRQHLSVGWSTGDEEGAPKGWVTIQLITLA